MAAHEHYMQRALALAGQAQAADEVPVGAVAVLNGEIIGEGWNQPQHAHDASAHAEIITLRAAGAAQKNYRLADATLYVTLEPCAMCAGAILQARIARVVFGAYDPKAGAAGSVVDVLGNAALGAQPEIIGGVLEKQCRTQLQNFFNARRN